MAESVLTVLARKRTSNIFDSDSVWDSRARQELASNWSEYVETGKDFDESVAELRGAKLISHTDLSSPAQPWAIAPQVALAGTSPEAFS